jgi:hypothetical protein
MPSSSPISRPNQAPVAEPASAARPTDRQPAKHLLLEAHAGTDDRDVVDGEVVSER